MVVTRPWEIIDKNRLLAIQIHTTDTARCTRVSAFYNIESTIVKGQSIHRFAQVLSEQCALGISINTPDATTRSCPPKRESCFGHIDHSFIIKSDTGRKREPISKKLHPRRQIIEHCTVVAFPIIKPR